MAFFVSNLRLTMFQNWNSHVRGVVVIAILLIVILTRGSLFNCSPLKINFHLISNKLVQNALWKQFFFSDSLIEHPSLRFDFFISDWLIGSFPVLLFQNTEISVCFTCYYGWMRDVTLKSMKNKSVHSCWFIHHAKFHCMMTTLNKLFKFEFERGELEKSRLIN